MRTTVTLEPDVAEEPFEVHASPMGLRAGEDPGHLNGLNDELEAQAFVALTSRLVASGRARPGSGSDERDG